MKKVKKAIIPAAGLGTRFLPASKSIPKEMFPILSKPAIQYIVEEAIESGIEDIIIITSKGKGAIEDHFDNDYILETTLKERKKMKLLESITKPSEVDIHYIRQKKPKGLGHAIWCARKFINDEPFAILLGDDIIDAKTPVTQQLINSFYETNHSIVGVQEVPYEKTKNYGIIEINGKIEDLMKVNRFVEKPQNNPPSNYAIMGRYVLDAKIFNILENQERGQGNEIQLTDAIEKLNNEDNVGALNFKGIRHDVGDIKGYLDANIYYGKKYKYL
ncbi:MULTISPECIES: UTP--glucose-1-phosphate uridylyltransferase GalU [Staphylococcus]|uniref:UTP--glucose-1-phosphate uridylyltransferase GalU n=1 Tax=Staphylococcus TaxID=1279 RepID=UPI001A986458|nr:MULTISPECIES: UTP--glucose-1-phosphate uridylyltransferase GalU [Staphylococcus]MBO1206152.1 UTP--glucose-1-phosphate uridylyltransferase GalU [Staphylococcus nepalensis]MEB8096978.1 UTP--glucose-1-phosphate uridylyltransferase GalU [Staphylococcus xylosus]UBV40152.1 UTP--glucose-1-phosphate uridylyltransferase GalU [Staphylococcus xylosus]